MMSVWFPVLRPKSHPTLRDWLLLPITGLLSLAFFLLLGTVLGFFVYPVTVPLALRLLWRERRRVQRYEAALRARGRLLSPEAIEAKLRNGEGSLIFTRQLEVWWAPEKPEQMTPKPVGPFEQVHFVPEDQAEPFIDSYLGVREGTAIPLILPMPRTFKPVFPAHYGKQRYPRVAAVYVMGPKPNAAPTRPPRASCIPVLPVI